MAFDGLLHLIIVENEDNRRRIQENKAVQRHLRDHANPFELPDSLFTKLFRLNKECCRQLINSLVPHLQEQQRITKVPTHLRILIALNFFGQGSYQLAVGHGNISVSQPVVSRCVAEVSDAITRHLMNEWIKFPTANQRHSLRNSFRNRDARFTGVVGVIDGTFVRIIAPPANHPVHPGQPYYCRKEYYAINTQVISDSEKRILSINSRYPGSVHDSAVWSMSGIRTMLQREFIELDCKDFLIGDSGYPLEPWLMTPFQNPHENSPEARFNTALSSIRIISEHVNGLLKGRFRCLHGHRALHYDPMRAAKIIYSCAVLHNMCIHYVVPVLNDVIPPFEEMQAGYNNVQVNHQANVIRNQLVRRYFQE